MKLFEKKDKEVVKKEKVRNPKRKKRIITALVVVIVIGVLVGLSMINASKPMQVACLNPSTEDVTAYVETSGTVLAEESKVYFAVTAAAIDNICVEAGDIVDAGDLLFTYDESDLDLAMKTAKLTIGLSEAEYGSTMEANDKTVADFNKASDSYDACVKRIGEIEHDIQDYDYAIAIRRGQLKEEGYTELQIAADDTLNEWIAKLADQQENLAAYKMDKANFEAEKKATEKSILTDTQKTIYSTKRSLEEISSKDTVETLKEVVDGVHADFGGIVTSVNVVKGSSVIAGAQVVEVADTSKLFIDLALTKNDAAKVVEGQSVEIKTNGNTYEGKVTRISHIAEKNQSGATIVKAKVSIDNADDNLILGAEASVKINVGESKNAIVVPNDVINYGSDGSFVYVISDGIVEKRIINLGISAAMYTEVKSGLALEDMIVTSDYSEFVSEGMTANGFVLE